MKRRLVIKLLAGCLSVTLLTPSFASAAEISQTVNDGIEQVAEPTAEPTDEEDALTDETENTVKADVQDEKDSQVLSRAGKVQGWVQSGSRWWYRHSDGSYTKADWEKINGKWYYFDASGWMKTGWQKIGGNWYYLNASGAMLTGWQKIGGSWYYLNASGKMLTGWQKIGGSWYYLNGSGKMLTGWQKIGGSWYYLNGSGKMLTGWQKIGGKWYYLNASGKMLTGWQKIGGKYYYMNTSGAMETDKWIGNSYVDGNGVWVEGKKKPVQQGWVKSGSRWWYRHSDGSYTKANWEKINGKWYYFDANGWMKTGWQKIGGSWYYLNASGAMVTGWQWIGGKCYYLDKSGVMAANKWIDGYYVDGSGAWIQGKKQETEGWVQSGNRWWYRHKDGSYTKSGWETIKGKKYYFDANGWMKTGWLKLGEKWYYLNASGAMMTGWQTLGGKSYYLYETGEMAADTWIGDYYVDGNGAWVEGKKPGDAGWRQEGERWYYVNADGSQPKSAWKTIDGVEYYFDQDGWRVTGWQKIGSSWYYLKSDGSKAYNYWVGNTGLGGYYISKFGTMVVGKTYSLDNFIYTFDDNGKCIAVDDRYVSVQDKNGRTYKVEKQFLTDPQVGVDVTEDELLAAAVYAEAGNQGLPGMTGVALVMLNRMDVGSYPSQANIMIYQSGQFEVARDGSLTRYLNNINSTMLNNAKTAVSKARAIMAAYKTQGTLRTVEGLTMPEGKTDFNYLGFMTPKSFESAGLDWEKTEAFTYLNTTFYTSWIKK